jgi:hypothetical protein
VIPPGDSAKTNADSVAGTVPGAPVTPRAPTAAPPAARPRDTTAAGARRAARPDSARRDTAGRARP